MFDNQFYPTPLALASRMVAKVQNRSDIGEVLDPSGGKDWMLNASDEEIREHNRLKGIERKKRGRTGERQTTPTERRRRKV